ncbi:MAG: outer membrane beta-barrel protein [Deltaproteobacteria bacterium]|nr:outer membrane beta-barrel protein [Deltaproteobacteria bacterium]
MCWRIVFAVLAAAATLAPEADGLAASHGIGLDAGYSSYLVPARRRGAGIGLHYRCLFLEDLGIRASGFVSRHVELVEYDETMAPETFILSGSAGLEYMIDVGPVSPVIALGGTFYHGDLYQDTRNDFGYFAGAGVEFPLSGPLFGGVEVDYFSQFNLSDEFPAYLLVLFRVTWKIGEAPEEISKI